MNIKRIVRGPIFWIVVVVMLALVLAQVMTASGGYEEKDTSTVISAIQDGNAAKVTLIDNDQEVRVELDNGDKIKANYIVQQGDLLSDLVQEVPPPGDRCLRFPRRAGSSPFCSPSVPSS